jgi:hypothetical protein
MPLWLTVVIVGVEYLEIIPSVKAMTAKSLGTLRPSFIAVLMQVTANSSLTAKTASIVYLQELCNYFAIINIFYFMIRFQNRYYYPNSALVYPSVLSFTYARIVYCGNE